MIQLKRLTAIQNINQLNLTPQSVEGDSSKKIKNDPKDQPIYNRDSDNKNLKDRLQMSHCHQ